MASNGLLFRAKKGKCRICHRQRCTIKHVKAVGEVSHGFATGHIWECVDIADCDKTAKYKIANKKGRYQTIEWELEKGRFKNYTYRS